PLERQPVLLSRDLDTTARLAYSSHASNAALLPDTITTHHSEPQTFTGIQLWLDQQWEDILTSLDARNPAGSLKIRQVATAMPKLGPGHSTHMAGHVWPLLDFAARAEWLQICQQAHYCIRVRA
ncbi:MAG: hypothetical protein ACXVCX_10260, partial [Ktedonobacterales bacterium]